MELEDFRKLVCETVLPYGVESLLYVEETGYGRSVPVETEEDVRFEYEQRMLD